MIDHTLDPLPRRTAPSRKKSRDIRGWFSRDTMARAGHYADVSWTRVLLPVAISLALGLAGLLSGPGALGAMLQLAALVGLAVNLPALLLKASFAPRRG